MRREGVVLRLFHFEQQPLRRGLPGDRAWFARAFCGGADLSSVGEEQHIWPYVCEFTFLDPLALLACHPATLEAFYEVTVKMTGGVEHMVIGAERSGVRDCAKLRSFILDGCRHALAASITHATSLSSDTLARSGRILHSTPTHPDRDGRDGMGMHER